MRIAIMADIHGNLPAFEAALAHCKRQSVDRVLIAGDVVNGGPDSGACWQLAASLNVPILRGNHERYVSLIGLEGAPDEWNLNRFEPVRWTAAQFTDEIRRAMADLPLVWEDAALGGLFVCHSTVRSELRRGCAVHVGCRSDADVSGGDRAADCARAQPRSRCAAVAAWFDCYNRFHRPHAGWCTNGTVRYRDAYGERVAS